MKKLNKREVAEILEREYINGDATLLALAARLNVTPCALSYYGKQLFPDWKQHSLKRMHLCIYKIKVVATENESG